MNERWKRNLPNIVQLEKKIEQIKDLTNSTEDELELEELKLQIIDLENEIKGLKKDFKTLVNETKEDLKTMYLDKEDDGDWTVARYHIVRSQTRPKISDVL